MVQYRIIVFKAVIGFQYVGLYAQLAQTYRITL